jgi:hypothetical protein
VRAGAPDDFGSRLVYALLQDNCSRTRVSHYIVAELPGGNVSLTNGLSGLTVIALGRSGFDVYLAYHATSCHGGTSGNGGSVTVDRALAREVFALSLAWAAALEHAYPEEFKRANPGWAARAAVPPRGDKSLRGEAIFEELEIEAELERRPPDEDSRERILDLVGDVVAFAEAVYLASPQGPVTLCFC